MKPIGLIVIGLLFHTLAYSQIMQSTIPWSFLKGQKSISDIPTVSLPELNHDSLINTDNQCQYPNRYAIYLPVNKNIYQAGLYTISEGGRIYRLRIESPGAHSLGILFGSFRLREGAKVFVYNEDKSKLLGAFTHLNNKESGKLALAEFSGDHVIIELNEPDSTAGKNHLVIESVSHSYKLLDTRGLGSPKSIPQEQPYETGITCPCAKNWRMERHAVCKITFQIGSSAHYCTGTLINNTRHDGTPYLLTANHCFDTDASAQTMVVYFNYENEDCNGNIAYPKSLSGANLLATNRYTDFTLVELTSVPPPEYQAYYIGWNRNEDSFLNATAIHHPNGSTKEIALDHDPPVSNESWIRLEDYNSPPHTLWTTNWDIGSSSTGSSGSPLLDHHKKLIGQLHGGRDLTDYFGKFSVSWDYGPDSNEMLKPWLDPDDTDSMEIEGFFLQSLPETYFEVPFTTVCPLSDIIFSDKSLFEPMTWEWTISPDNVVFSEGTNENFQHPVIRFNEPGYYSIKVKVTNVHGADSLYKMSYINVSENLDLSVTALNREPVCAYDMVDYPLIASGAEFFNWTSDTLDNGMYLRFSELSNDTVLTNLSSDQFSETITIPVTLTGTQAECVDTLVHELIIHRQVNDSIQHALPLLEGTSPLFSNICATAELNEPYPEIGECDSQYSWCIESDTEILDNSLWFYFFAPESEKVWIKAEGINSQIALYEATEYSDILSGNDALYSIIAANDDYALYDAVGSSYIKEAHLNQGSMYWLQVDGNGMNETGNFMLDLYYEDPLLPQPDYSNYSSVWIYPNPSDGIVHYRIYCKEIEEITIRDILGNVVRHEKISSLFNTIDLSEYPPQLFTLIFHGAHFDEIRKVLLIH